MLCHHCELKAVHKAVDCLLCRGKIDCCRRRASQSIQRHALSAWRRYAANQERMRALIQPLRDKHVQSLLATGLSAFQLQV